jgi:hypothetical protein
MRNTVLTAQNAFRLFWLFGASDRKHIFNSVAFARARSSFVGEFMASGFKFNFGGAAPEPKPAPVVSVVAKQVLPVETVIPPSNLETIQVGSVSFTKVKLPHAERLPIANDSLKAAVKDSDVVPGVYEGGYDLASAVWH